MEFQIKDHIKPDSKILLIKLRSIGDVVYNMIEHELMKKSESDRREDFDDVYDFKEALQQQFDISSAD